MLFVWAVLYSVGEHVTAISFHDSAVYTAVGTLSGYIYVYDWRNPKKPVCQMPAHSPHPVRQLLFQVRNMYSAHLFRMSGSIVMKSIGVCELTNVHRDRAHFLNHRPPRNLRVAM